MEYARYRPYMLRVLGQLSRQGYDFTFDQGFDLIHEFLASQWEALQRNYDPSKSKFTTYLTQAFFYDARRRLAKMESWKSRLIDASSLSTMVGPHSEPGEIAEHHEALQQIGFALDALDQRHRDILIEWLTGRSSERELATRFGISRFRVRELLIDALGQVVLNFGEFTDLDRYEIDVIQSLWRDGRNPRTTALHLGITLDEVHSARRRVAGRLMNAIRTPRVRLAKHNSLRRNSMNENAIVKLKNVLLSPNDNAGLEELRMNARAICGALDTDEEEQLEFSSEETAILDDNPKWTAQVYDALASGTEPIDEVNKQDQEVADAISQILKSEDEELGRSFSEALLETMPVDYSEWGHWFYDVPPVDDEVFREIMQDRTVQAGMPRTEGLARHGLTPGIIFEACDGVRMLLDRLRELSIHPERYPTTDATKDLRKVLAWTRQLQENKEPVTFDFSLEPGGVTGNEHPAVPLNLLLAEISDTPDCPPKAAEPLLRWFFKIIPYTPLLFAGYEAEPHSDFIRLTHDPLQDEQHANLFQRWSASLDYA